MGQPARFPAMLEHLDKVATLEILEIEFSFLRPSAGERVMEMLSSFRKLRVLFAGVYRLNNLDWLLRSCGSWENIEEVFLNWHAPDFLEDRVAMQKLQALAEKLHSLPRLRQVVVSSLFVGDDLETNKEVVEGSGTCLKFSLAKTMSCRMQWDLYGPLFFDVRSLRHNFQR